MISGCAGPSCAFATERYNYAFKAYGAIKSLSTMVLRAPATLKQLSYFLKDRSEWFYV